MSYLQSTLNECFGIDNNTSATIIITLIIFIIGLSFTEFIKILNSCIQRKRVRKICRINLRSLEIGIKKQDKAYLKYIESLNFTNRRGFNFSDVEITSIVALQEMGYKKIYESYFTGIENIISKKNKLKAFEKLWSIIISVPLCQDKMKSYSNEHLKSYNEWNEKRNESLKEFNKLCDSFIFQYQGENIKDLELKEYIISIDKIKFNYQCQIDFTNPKIVEDFMVQPMLILNRKTKNRPIIHDFNIHLLSSSLYYNNMKQILEVGKKQTFIFSCNFRCKARILTLIKNIF